MQLKKEINNMYYSFEIRNQVNVILLVDLIIFAFFSFVGFIYYFIKDKRTQNKIEWDLAYYEAESDLLNTTINDLKDKNSSLEKQLSAASVEIEDLIKLSIKNEVNLKRSIEKLNADLTCAIADRDRHKHNFNELAKSKGMVNFFSNENLLEKSTSVTSDFSQALEKVSDKLTDNHCLFCGTIIYPGKHFCGRVHQRAYQKNGFQSIKQTVINRFNKSNRYKI